MSFKNFPYLTQECILSAKKCISQSLRSFTALAFCLVFLETLPILTDQSRLQCWTLWRILSDTGTHWNAPKQKLVVSLSIGFCLPSHLLRLNVAYKLQ